jgi:UPF0755 protein
MKSFWQSTLIIIACISILALTHAYVFITTPTTPVRPVMMEIKPGTSAWEISRELTRQGIVSDPYMFLATAQAMQKARHLQAGTYVFEGKHFPLDIVHILFKGRTLRYRVTIPEGSNIFDVGEIIAATGLLTKQDFVQKAQDSETTAFFDIDTPSMEGHLYPDTYFLSPHMTALEIMAKMLYRFDQVYTSTMQQQADALGLSTSQVLTLASIIEKEAVFNKEKPVIASVFHNRLRRKMPLQSDPTAIYGIDNFHRRITPRDLRKDSPYNTYKHTGLPPGPICNPDKYSINAALWPAKTDYLFFVSQGNGSHYFSRTLKEHNRAIAKTRKRKK